MKKFSKLSTVSERLYQSLQKQPEKYNRKGYGKFVALLTFTAYFTILPEILRMFWPSILSIFSEKVIFILSIVGVNFIVLIIYNLIMVLIYRAKHPFFQNYRVSEKPWPWETDYQKWKITLRKSLKSVIMNSLFWGPMLLVVDSYIDFKYKSSMQQIPETTTIVWQFFFCMLIEDMVFYWGHRFLHHPSLYWIHKQHHQYNISITLAAEYTHPIEYVFCNGLASGLGYKILSHFYQVHMFTIIIWIMFRIIETCDGHSGYEWSWAQSTLFPLSAGSDYHFFHHSNNVGNYGSILCFWDTLNNTNSDYRKYLKDKHE